MRRVPRSSRPVLLLVVYGAFLVVVGVTASVQTALVSLHFSTAAVNTAVAGDAAIIRAFVNDGLIPDDLTPDADPARVSHLEALLVRLAEQSGLTRIEVSDPSGSVRLATDRDLGDATPRVDEDFRTALAGTPTATVAADEAGMPGELLRVTFPLLNAAGTPEAVVRVWRDAGPILAPMADVQRDMLIVTLAAALVAGVVLYLVFRAAQDRIRRQTEQLLEATERDALTGLRNHGALVADLAIAMEAGREAGTPIAVALVDVDNFRLLNDTHGHDAGDTVLLRIAATLRAALDGDVVFGRYGPDEFLVIAGEAAIATLEPGLERLRDVLVGESLDFDAATRLPITVSAAIATFPRDADSVTALLATVAHVLGEAKASGGDAIRTAEQRDQPSQDARGFDVLQGLVFAIDTKDRYTKRHSEDVSRYGVFLARQLGLDGDLVEAIRIAGLLHDVGKIGIPDEILRKPGALTGDEYEVVKQHVALGDAIVRDLVDVDTVRAGIRHHHERWDGNGYLHGLAGADIPLVARVLAIGDAFSAMTTSRPYRKALPTEEALRRLGDAAGTQLDEALVRAFIDGFESAPDAPRPEERARAALWVPSRRVA